MLEVGPAKMGSVKEEVSTLSLALSLYETTGKTGICLVGIKGSAKPEVRSGGLGPLEPEKLQLKNVTREENGCGLTRKWWRGITDCTGMHIPPLLPRTIPDKYNGDDQKDEDTTDDTSDNGAYIS